MDENELQILNDDTMLANIFVRMLDQAELVDDMPDGVILVLRSNVQPLNPDEVEPFERAKEAWRRG